MYNFIGTEEGYRRAQGGFRSTQGKLIIVCPLVGSFIFYDKYQFLHFIFNINTRILSLLPLHHFYNYKFVNIVQNKNKIIL